MTIRWRIFPAVLLVQCWRWARSIPSGASRSGRQLGASRRMSGPPVQRKQNKWTGWVKRGELCARANMWNMYNYGLAGCAEPRDQGPEIYLLPEHASVPVSYRLAIHVLFFIKWLRTGSSRACSREPARPKKYFVKGSMF